MKRAVLIVICLLVVTGGFAAYSQRGRIGDFVYEWKRPTLPEAQTYEEAGGGRQRAAGSGQRAAGGEMAPVPTLKPVPVPVVQPKSSPPSDTNPVPPLAPPVPPAPLAPESAIPATMNLAVPFTTQAPYTDWGYPYQEACEEASLVMVHGFYEGASGHIDAETADKEILALVEFEKKTLGMYEDTTAEQTGFIAEQFYGYGTIQVIPDPTVEQIKTVIASGRPVLVPADGRLLKNPFFQSPGPPYHMLTIRGYTEDSFIVNDPGTRRGEAYVYPIETVMTAMHDWTGDKDTIDEGGKVMLVVYP